MFFNCFQNTNSCIWGGFDTLSLPWNPFMQAPYTYNNFNFIPYDNFQTPIFNFNNNWNIPSFNNYNNNLWSANFNTSFQSFIPSTNTDNFVRSTESTSKTENKINPLLKDYNPIAGQKLADIAMQGRQFDSWDDVKGRGKCALYVSNALERAGMSNGLRGDAYQMITILQNNKYFKEIPTNDLDVEDYPTGSIAAYERGSQGYSEQDGHIEIITQDGEGVSQAITENVKEADALFIPV